MKSYKYESWLTKPQGLSNLNLNEMVLSLLQYLSSLSDKSDSLSGNQNEPIEILNNEEDIWDELQHNKETQPLPEPFYFENCRFLNKREKQLKYEKNLQKLGKKEELEHLEIIKLLGYKYDVPFHCEMSDSYSVLKHML